MTLEEMLEASIHTVLAKYDQKTIYIVNEANTATGTRKWKVVIVKDEYTATRTWMATYDTPWELIVCLTLEHLIPVNLLDWQAHNLYVYPFFWELGVL